jgi:hypothetical protein
MKTLHISIIVIAVSIVIGTIIFAVILQPIKVGTDILVARNVTSTESISVCDNAPYPSTDEFSLQKITWISVIEIEKNQTSRDCTILNEDSIYKLPKLEQSMVGATQCKEGNHESCSILSSIGMTSVYDFGVAVDDSLNYRTSLTYDETENLLHQIKMTVHGKQDFGDVQYRDKYYQVILQTTDQYISPQITAEFLQPINYTGDPLQKGESINYTVLVKTLATYGKPANVTFSARPNAKDSGLHADFEPSNLVIPERSEAKTNLIVHADENTRDGIYSFFYNGRTGNDMVWISCSSFNSCPSVQIGDSPWSIQTYGNDTYGGNGNVNPIPSLKLDVVTDKIIYHSGENVEIKNFIINNSTKKITLDKDLRLWVQVYNKNQKGSYVFFYAILAMYDGQPMVLEPKSKTLLARAFYWDQQTFRYMTPPQWVGPGTYIIDSSFTGYNGTIWDTEAPISIK